MILNVTQNTQLFQFQWLFLITQLQLTQVFSEAATTANGLSKKQNNGWHVFSQCFPSPDMEEKYCPQSLGALASAEFVKKP
jgi:hypothetical protein